MHGTGIEVGARDIYLEVFKIYKVYVYTGCKCYDIRDKHPQTLNLWRSGNQFSVLLLAERGKVKPCLGKRAL